MITVESFAPVESLKPGEYVRRKAGANVTYIRGEYDRATKRYSLVRFDDTSREVFVKRGTLVFVGFSF